MEAVIQDMPADPDRAIVWSGDRLLLLDQRKLPAEERYLALSCAREIAEAIRSMVVRGAPAIGITAAYGVVLAARERFARGSGISMQRDQDAVQVLAALEDSHQRAWLFPEPIGEHYDRFFQCVYRLHNLGEHGRQRGFATRNSEHLRVGGDVPQDHMALLRREV